MSEIAARFRRMADAIEKNENFGGAFVVVPPEGAGESVQTLLLDPTPDPAQFWQMLLRQPKTAFRVRQAQLLVLFLLLVLNRILNLK